MKTAIIVICSLGTALCVGLFVHKRVSLQLATTRTHDVFGQILVAADKSLSEATVAHYDAAKAALAMFPSIRSSNGQLLDAWGNPIRIEIMAQPEGFLVELRSSGSDGEMDTEDDIVRSELLLKTPATR